VTKATSGPGTAAEIVSTFRLTETLVAGSQDPAIFLGGNNVGTVDVFAHNVATDDVYEEMRIGMI
jgi:hypothetical protein